MYKIAIIFTISITAAYAQQLRGIVRSKSQKEILSGVIIYVKGELASTESDSLGQFTLTLPYLPCKVFYSLDGYDPDSILVHSTEKPLELFLNQDITSLATVVISGTMTERRLLDSPIPVEVYSPALFKKNPSPSVFESLSMINGVQPQINCNVCNTGDIHINGLEGPYTMVLIDGMPIVSSLATVYGFSGIPQSLIKRIEVVKGPSSTLYGSEAVAGVINIITKDPTQTDRLSTDASITSLGEVNLDVATKYKIRKQSSAMFGINYFNYSIPRDINNDGFTDVTLQNRVSAFNKYFFHRKSNKKSLLSLRYVFEDRWGGQLGYKKSLRGSDSVYSESIITNRIELIGTYELLLKEAIRLDYSYNYHNQDSYYGTTKYAADQHTAFAQLVWNKRWSSGLEQVSGIPLRYTRYNDNTPATNKATTTVLPGIFSQWEYKINTRHTTLLGLRYDHNSLHGSIFTPRLSYKYSMSSRSVIRFTTGSGYRVVNVFTEEHASLTGSRTLEIRKGLQPEKTWNANLNYSQQWVIGKGFASMDISGFYTYFLNKIIPDYDTDSDKIIYDNIEGHAISRGFSINTELQLKNGFKGNLGATFLNVFRTDSAGVHSPQLLTPKLNLKWTLSYTLKKYKASVDLTGDLKSPMYLPVVPNDFRPAQSPTFCLLGLQATKQIKKVELYIGAKNLLNFIPKYPLLRPFDPFDKLADDTIQNPYGYTFDTSYNYAPIQGVKWYFGMRCVL